MKENEKENYLLDNVRKCLDVAAGNLDDRTVRALKRSRSEALEEFERNHGLYKARRWLSAGGIATAAVLVATVSMFFISSQKSLPLKNPEDFEILSVNEQQELYKDLDFYRWLAEQRDAG